MVSLKEKVPDHGRSTSRSHSPNLNRFFITGEAVSAADHARGESNVVRVATAAIAVLAREAGRP